MVFVVDDQVGAHPVIAELTSRLKWNTEVIRTGEGWDNLLSELHELLVVLSPDYRLYQVKEKFGQLRFYADYVQDRGYDDKMEQIFRVVIRHYEEISGKTCEVCGGYGELCSKQSVLRTLCVDHAAEAGFTSRSADSDFV